MSYILTILHGYYSDNPEFDIFDAGGPQCQFVTSVTTHSWRTMDAFD